MSMDDSTLVFTIDVKKLVAIFFLASITIVTLYTYTTALLAFIAPYPGDYPLDVTSSGSYTTDNTAESSFTRGETVRIKATLEKGTDYWTSYPDYTSYTSFSGTTSYRVFITILDLNNKPVKFYTSTGALSPGESKNYQTDMPTTSSFTSGTYTAQVLAWSTGLPDGVSETPTVTEFTFTIS